MPHAGACERMHARHGDPALHPYATITIPIPEHTNSDPGSQNRIIMKTMVQTLI
jgi:hypothetical protein